MFSRRLPRLGLLIVFGLLVGLTATLHPSQSASAATRFNDLSPSDQAKSFASYKALRNCFAVGAYKNSIGTLVPPVFIKAWTMSANNAVDFDWFHGWSNVTVIPGTPAGVATNNTSDVGVVLDTSGDQDGIMNCGDEEGRAWLPGVAQRWGYDGPELLCALDFGRDVNQSNCSQIVSGATNDFHAPGGILAPATVPGNLDSLWTGALGASGTGIANIGAGEYQLYLQSFKAACRAITPGSGDYTIYELNEATNTLEPVKYGVGDRDRGTGYSVRVHHGLSMTCQQLADALDSEDDDRAVIAYKEWLKNNDGTQDNTETDDQQCDENGTCPPIENSCAVPGIGWMVCPVLTAGAGMADQFYGLIEGFLETEASLVNTDPNLMVNGVKVGTGTYTAWGMMRSVANVAFVIVVLIIIFSQVASVGVSNYGVKKLLPRILVAALLVNVSFFICQIAVDLSNILGVSLKETLEGIAGQIRSGGGAAIVGDQSTNLAGITATILVGGGLLWANIGAVVVAIVGALIALLTIFVILIARKVLIVLLIVIAPLAFVAYLLPNTEPLFQRWRKALTALLLLYPIIGLLYGGAVLASAILLQVAGDDMLLKLAAYVALVVPLIAAIPILRGSLSAFGSIGSAIQNAGQKFGNASKAKTQKTYDNSRLGQFKKYRTAEWDKRRAKIQSGAAFAGGKKNPLNWLSAANRGLNRAPGARRFGDQLSAKGDYIVDQEDAELMKESTAKVTNMKNAAGVGLSTSEMLDLLEGNDVGNINAKQLSDHDLRALTQQVGQRGDAPELNRLIDTSSHPRMQKSPIVRKTLSDSLRSAPSRSKMPWVGNTTLSNIENGSESSATAMTRAAMEGKVTAETLASGDDKSVRSMVDAVRSMPAGAARSQAVTQLQQAYNDFSAPGFDPTLKAKVASGGVHDTEIQKIVNL